jgi:hypothetical protein
VVRTASERATWFGSSSGGSIGLPEGKAWTPVLLFPWEESILQVDEPAAIRGQRCLRLSVKRYL